jgi:hypothetical protein
MIENSPPDPSDLPRPLVIPSPIALYVSGELIFELYDGGQPCRRFSIHWERFVPGKDNEPETAAQSSSTSSGTHQD